MTPSWLRVDRAMIFLRSHSTIAAIPAINIVHDAINKRAGENRGKGERVGKKRISRYTPAVTRVDE